MSGSLSKLGTPNKSLEPTALIARESKLVLHW